MTEKVCGLYGLKGLISISAIQRSEPVEPVIAVMPFTSAVLVLPRMTAVTLGSRLINMPVKTIMKRIAMWLCLMSAGAHLQAARASENQAESKSSTQKADVASATGTSENASVNDLTLQTVLPCA